MQKFIKKMKKGFTIMELVIVIAVIAILAAVLIPTFSNIVDSANESAAMQEARIEWTNYSVEVATSSGLNDDYVVVYAPADADEEEYYYFEVTDGQFDPTAVEDVYTYSSSETPSLTVSGGNSTAEAAKNAKGEAYVSSNNNIKIFKLVPAQSGGGEG